MLDDFFDHFLLYRPRQGLGIELRAHWFSKSSEAAGRFIFPYLCLLRATPALLFTQVLGIPSSLLTLSWWVGALSAEPPSGSQLLSSQQSSRCLLRPMSFEVRVQSAELAETQLQSQIWTSVTRAKCVTSLYRTQKLVLVKQPRQDAGPLTDIGESTAGAEIRRGRLSSEANSITLTTAWWLKPISGSLSPYSGMSLLPFITLGQGKERQWLIGRVIRRAYGFHWEFSYSLSMRNLSLYFEHC